MLTPLHMYPEGGSSSHGEGVSVLVSVEVSAEVRVHLVRTLDGERRVVISELSEEID